MIFQLKVSRGVNFTTRSKAIVGPGKKVHKGQGQRRCDCLPAHMLVAGFELWELVRAEQMSGQYARDVIARERIS